MSLHATPNLGKVGSLGAALEDLERNISKLELKSGIQAVEILQQMDLVYTKILELDSKGQDVHREIEQFSELGNVVRKHARTFLKNLSPGYLEKARSSQERSQNAWWWFLDQWQREKTKQSLKRSAIRSGIVIAALAVVIVLYKIFLAPDAATQAAYDHEFNASQALTQEEPDYEKALEEISTSIQYDATDLGNLALQIALYEKLGKTEEAQKSTEAARALASSEDEYLIYLSNAYLQIGENQKSLDTATQAITLNPESAEGYMYLAQAYLAINQQADAYFAFEKASELASKQEKVELLAIIRVRMAYLSQEMGIGTGE